LPIVSCGSRTSPSASLQRAAHDLPVCRSTSSTSRGRGPRRRAGRDARRRVGELGELRANRLLVARGALPAACGDRCGDEQPEREHEGGSGGPGHRGP
jgi:hypothetical protein